MGTKLIILITLSAATLTLATKPFSISKANEPTCMKPGISCLNCWTSLNCIDLGNGTYYPEEQHCPTGRTCKDSTGICETDGNYECYNNQVKFECYTVGTFPSPFNCDEYFICVKAPNNMMLRFAAKCDPTYKFDPVRKLCRKNLEKSCLSSIPVCRNDSQMGAFPNNSNIYYRCKLDKVDIGYNFVPELYGCPFNHNFNGTHCVDPYVLDGNGHCLYKGFFAHPTNCRQYYDCSYVGESPTVRTCSSQYQMYSRLEEKCVDFTCNSYNE